MKDGSILRRCAGPFGHAPLIFFIVFLHRNGRGHERIDKFSARVVHWPEILSTTPVLTLSAVYTGLTRFQTLSPPRPPLPPRLSTSAHAPTHARARGKAQRSISRPTFVPPGLPVSWIMMAPSISPSTPGGPNNPGLRLYKFETTTGQVGGGKKTSIPRLFHLLVSDRKIR